MNRCILFRLIAAYFLLSTVVLYAQNSDYSAEISSTAILSSQDEIPFWLQANTGTEFSELTNFSGAINGFYSYNFSNFSLEAGAYVFARDGVEDNIQRRDLYVQVKNNWVKVTLGSKQWDEAFFGLSTTNQNYLYSNNARPLPGLIIEANEPLKLFKGLKLDWGIAHYQLNDDRFVEDTRLHYKRVNLIVQLTEKSKVTAGIQHFVQWAGTSPRFGELKSDLGAFWNVLIANKTTELGVEGEIENAVGNHLGSFLFKYDLASTSGDFSFYHEHPFEDGSGTRFQNFPDGVWGLTYKPNSNKFIKAILYEYVDTRSQSGTSNNNRTDGYFGNLVYNSGWSYEQNIIGNPFFKRVRNTDGVLSTASFEGTRFQVHHLGVTGEIKSITWNLKASYSKNLGRFGVAEFDTPKKDFYAAAQVGYTYRNNHNIRLLAGLDLTSYTYNTVAAGISYRYTFSK